ncbi:hypothetical protein BJ508DRAFT_414457 [Ascobolus immersus RN42]|uniref:Nudix hydrolase domain-containing protein n=1 Tax=Ascobolus immersus RN42 TaxID=1160509 RepID=A0A3N4IK24_ASCIM|nr:hypothetical protein BJ508DRAFT_414457 [Ascobolus immersus RN42]
MATESIQFNLRSINSKASQDTVTLKYAPTLLPPNGDTDLSSVLLNFAPYKTWLTNLTTSLSTQHDSSHPFKDAPFTLNSITIQSIDYKGNKPDILFVKLKTEITNKDGDHIPGIALLRGGSVGMLVILEDNETGDEWVPLTVQPRIPVGTLTMLELPAGMLDGSDQFAGQAAKELKEECGLTIKQNELVDLGELAMGKDKAGLVPSAGGCDETIRLFMCRKKIGKDKIEELKGKKGALYDKGEKITLEIVKLKDLWKSTQDFKALAAWALYKGLKDEGKIAKEISLWGSSSQ